MTAPLLPIAAVDVALPVLEARIAGLREQAHQLDPADAAFAALACACPTACSCDADFPAWAAALAAQPTYRHPQEKR